ncbi:MAG: TlpA family protein disulfide reductase [Polyangiaceae bacterium]|nr:TlpA family protein disulfide reductase [Polyangiaceae bacterium]
MRQRPRAATRLTGALSLAAACACSTAQMPGASAQAPVVVRAPERMLRRGQVVPDFRVETFDGSTIDSRDWVGSGAFVLVFFATWCPVCRYKLPVVRGLAAEYAHDVPFLGVVLDPPEYRDRVLGYVARYELSFPLIDGHRFARFTASYDPSHTVPVVIVIDRRGFPVEYQSGFSWRDADRLRAALDAARSTPGDAVRTGPDRAPVSAGAVPVSCLGDRELVRRFD